MVSPPSIAENTYIFNVPRASAVRPFVVGRVRAVDTDAGANAQVRYRLRNATDRAGLEAFGVDARSGQIRVRTSKGLDKDRSVSGRNIRVCSSLLKSCAPTDELYSLSKVC